MIVDLPGAPMGVYFSLESSSWPAADVEVIDTGFLFVRKASEGRQISKVAVMVDKGVPASMELKER